MAAEHEMFPNFPSIKQPLENFNQLCLLGCKYCKNSLSYQKPLKKRQCPIFKMYIAIPKVILTHHIHICIVLVIGHEPKSDQKKTLISSYNSNLKHTLQHALQKSTFKI